jgi:4-amino-4-deoxy-L-arabinose transferase-like glycosyltransferase
MSQRWKLALAAILFLALVLRAWGITFGLPHRYHIDEPYYVLGALKLAQGEIHLTVPQNTPNIWQFILLGEYGLLYLVGRLTGSFSQPSDLASLYLTDPSVFYLIARASSLLAGVATVGLIYWLGKDVFDRQTGLLAALFLALAFLHARDSHYAVNDAFIALLTTVACYTAILYLRGGKRRLLLLGALACGAAIGMKYRPVTFVLPLVLAVLWRDGREGILRASLVRRIYLPLTGALALGFLIGFPGVILNTAVFLHHVRAAIEQAGISGGGQGGGIRPATISNAWLLVVGVGLPMLVASVAGLGLSLATLRREPWLLFLTGVAYYALIAVVRPHLIRYTLPLLPLLAVFAAFAVNSVLIRVRGWRATWVGLSAVALILLVVALPLANTVRHDYLLTQVDTRTLAKRWIEENVPAGSKIALDWPVHGPPLSTANDPEPQSRATYELFMVGLSGLSEYPLQYYRDQGFDYLITSGFIANIQQAGPKGQEFYASLDRELEMVQAFWPNRENTEPPYIFDEIYGPIVSQWQRERPGPVLKIYKVQRPTGTG